MIPMPCERLWNYGYLYVFNVRSSFLLKTHCHDYGLKIEEFDMLMKCSIDVEKVTLTYSVGVISDV